MSGNVEGGLKAAQKNKARHGSDFYKRIGAVGGRNGTGGGFAVMDKARHKDLSAKGGRLGKPNTRRKV
jgi:hypothetical protein